MDVSTAIQLSKKTISIIKQNLFWSFGYNTLGIPIAMGILYLFGGPLLNPIIAATAMSLNSLSVLLNALLEIRIISIITARADFFASSTPGEDTNDIPEHGYTEGHFLNYCLRTISVFIWKFEFTFLWSIFIHLYAQPCFA
jgi:hypothetical protein